MLKIAAPLIAVFFSLGMFAVEASAATYEVDLGSLGKINLKSAQFRIWLPETVKEVRGMILLTPGKNLDGRSAASEAEWQGLAAKQQFGIMAAYFQDTDKKAGYEFRQEVAELMEKALKQGALSSKHPELGTVPVALWGYSTGANVSRTYAQNFASRTVAIGLTKPTAGGPDSTGGGAELPVLIATGMKEKPEYRNSNENNWEQQRKYSAPWALTVHPLEGPELGGSLSVVLPFLSECITLRLGPPKLTHSPGEIRMLELEKIKVEDGWLGNPRTLDISPYKTYVGNKRDACWFPGENSAQAWKAYLTVAVPK